MKVLLVTLCLLSIPNYSRQLDCAKNLRRGQYFCPDPSYDHIDENTQQIRGCTKERKARVRCVAAEGIICNFDNSTFYVDNFPCNYTNGYKFDTALLFSIFFGMFGIDRFYLGYPAIGLLKLFTLGFMFLGQLVDVILIASQIVGPADGSSYVIPFYGAGLSIIRSNNMTYRLPQDNW